MRGNIKNPFYLILLFIFCPLILVGQNKKETKKNNSNWMEEISSRITPYGSIRIGIGFAEEGELGISNNAPRIGFRFKHALSENEEDNFNIIGRVEFGLNLVSRDDVVEFAVDPGAGIAQVGDAVFTRLGYVGISYQHFEFTFGKQNSLYYTLGASNVDKFLAFGGASLGVWNISDGGVSGTGRANQVFILKYSNSGFTIGFQGQTRNISDASESIDSYGFGANYKVNGFSIGIGYNKVNDGVANPLPDQAKEGDEAFIASASYEKNRFTIGASYSSLKQHQKTGTTFYDAKGLEIYTRYKFSKNEKWHVATGISHLNPDDDQGLGDFNTKFGILEVGYNFKKSSHIFLSTKQDYSENSAGGSRSQSLYGIGIRFGF